MQRCTLDDPPPGQRGIASVWEGKQTLLDRTSDVLGHSTVGITLDTYSHMLTNMQTVAATAIQDALGHIIDPKPPADDSNVVSIKPKANS